jgi:hypothetical protein
VVDLGRIVSNIWTATPLNDLHNPENPAEVQRLWEEHPVEDEYRRTKGQLGVTRGKHTGNVIFWGSDSCGMFIALGDAILKVPLDLPQVLTTMWGCPIFPEITAKWAAKGKHTPYISSTPSVAHFCCHGWRF